MMLITVAWLIVISTVLVGFGMMSALGRSIDERSTLPGLFVLMLGGAGGVLAYLGSPTALGLGDVPMAFVLVVASFIGP